MRAVVKKYASSFVCSFCILALIWIYRSFYAAENAHNQVGIFVTLDNQRECYKSVAFEKYSEFENMLPDIADKELEINTLNCKNIFFLQTDCIHDGEIKLTARQACAVESAALTNPKHKVVLLYPSPVGFLNSTPLPFVDAIMSYPNTRIYNYNIMRALKFSLVMDYMDKHDDLYLSEFVNYHMLNLLKIASLWRYGGTAMDLDVIVQKDLTKLGLNYAGAGPGENIYSYILSLSHFVIGGRISKALLADIALNFNASDIHSNGQTLWNKIVREFCNGTVSTSDMTKAQCDGFQVLPKEEFYAYDWDNWQTAFLESELSNFMDIVKDSSVVHFTDQLSRKAKIVKDSLVGYNVLARTFCPKVYAAITDDTF